MALNILSTKTESNGMIQAAQTQMSITKSNGLFLCYIF